MRLHALIFSALMRVPFIGISYDPKIDNFLSLIGLEPGASVQHLDAEKLYNKTCHILEHGMPPKVWDSVQDLQHYAGENANILRRFVFSHASICKSRYSSYVIFSPPTKSFCLSGSKSTIPPYNCNPVLVP